MLTENDVTWSISVEVDDIPVRGNALASGDDDVDRQAEDEILAGLRAGNVWAWAHVTVTGTYDGHTAEEHLGGCSYDDEAAFKADDYYTDMRAAVLHKLNGALEAAAKPVRIQAERDRLFAVVAKMLGRGTAQAIAEGLEE